MWIGEQYSYDYISVESAQLYYVAVTILLLLQTCSNNASNPGIYLYICIKRTILSYLLHDSLSEH